MWARGLATVKTNVKTGRDMAGSSQSQTKAELGIKPEDILELGYFPPQNVSLPSANFGESQGARRNSNRSRG